MRNRRSIAAFTAMFAILLGCFFMPNYVAGISDRNTLGKRAVIDAKSISYEAGLNLTMPERLVLFASSDKESITLKNGKALTESEASARVLSELSLFFGDFESAALGLSIYECEASFIIDAENPSINMIVWDFWLTGIGDARWNVILDEETGVILHIFSRAAESAGIAVPPGSTEDVLSAEADYLRELIGAYYNVPGVLTYKLSGGLGYYNVQLDFDGEEVVLYGIVRETGFTVNE